MTTSRLFVDAPLAAGQTLALPESTARHAQVLRLQPGHMLVLFDGRGGEWRAEVASMGRREVSVRVHAHVNVSREAAVEVTIALGMPANERMDTLVEKATELGVATVQPLCTARSVLRLQGERAERRRAHWQAVAVAAPEQGGRTCVPALAPARSLGDWLEPLPASSPADDEDAARWLLSPAADAPRWAPAAPSCARAIVLSGPEGGLDAGEEARARACGFVSVGLGPRVLRADTAPLVVLAALSLWR